jgi:hypothetical protein
MTERGRRLHATADNQIERLLGLTSPLDEAMLGLPCPAREKLGDGTIAASAWHTAENYQEIAVFVTMGDRVSTEHQPTRHGAHRVPRLHRAVGSRTGRQSRPPPRHGRTRRPLRGRPI